MQNLFSSPLFGITLTIVTFQIGLFVSRKLRSPMANPNMIAMALCIILLLVTGIPLESYQRGGDIISMFLSPATAVLAISIYSQLETLKKNLLPIAAGCLAGSVTSIVSVIGLSRLFGLDEELTVSLIPKSVTTPIAIAISEQKNGIVSLTVAAVILTGIFGAILAPALIRLFRVRDPVARGVAIGTCSHALGTSRAIELGEVEGAMSGIAIGVSGIIPVILALFL